MFKHHSRGCSFVPLKATVLLTTTTKEPPLLTICDFKLQCRSRHSKHEAEIVREQWKY